MNAIFYYSWHQLVQLGIFSVCSNGVIVGLFELTDFAKMTAAVYLSKGGGFCYPPISELLVTLTHLLCGRS